MIFDIGFCIHQHCSPTFLLLDPFCGPKEPWQTFTLAHTYSNLTSTGSVQTLFLETGGWGSCVQWNRDSAPMWKKDLYTVVSERKRGERVRWSPETGDGWRSPTAVKPRNLLPPSQNFPSFICYFHFFSPTTPQKRFRGQSVWQLSPCRCDIARQWDDRFTVKFLKEIPPEEKLDRQHRECAQSLVVAEKAQSHKESTITKFSLTARERKRIWEQIAATHRACPSHGHEGPAMAVCGWRPWDQILRWRLPAAWTHGTEEPLTMTLGVGRGDWVERPGTVRPMFTALQRSNGSTTALKRVPQSRIKVWPQMRVVDNRETTWDLSWACEVQWLRQVEKWSHCTVTNAFLSFGQINQLCNILLTIVQL